MTRMKSIKQRLQKSARSHRTTKIFKKEENFEGRKRGLEEPTFVQITISFLHKNKSIVKKDNDAIIETNCHS